MVRLRKGMHGRPLVLPGEAVKQRLESPPKRGRSEQDSVGDMESQDSVGDTESMESNVSGHTGSGMTLVAIDSPDDFPHEGEFVSEDFGEDDL